MGGLTLPVSEVFGAWQGEGPFTGRRCTFVRLGRCNLHCSWCDTPYTWDTGRYNVGAECPDIDTEIVAADIEDDYGIVVLSGGEPLIHQRTTALLDLFCNRLPHVELHVETNGTIHPVSWMAQRVQHWSVSPKIAEQGDMPARRIKPQVIECFVGLPGAIFKIVCRDIEEVYMASAFASHYGIPVSRLWIMPEGVSEAAVIDTARAIAPAVGECGANLTLRQHVLMYGAERKR